MVHQVAGFSDALLAWEQWNLTEFAYKSDHLLSFKSELESLKPAYGPVSTFHIQQASNLLEESHQLVGPTGETNELYVAGRGVALIVLDECDNKLSAQQTTIAMVSAALLAGNSVMLCSDDVELNLHVEKAAAQANLPSNLIQAVSYDAAQQLLDCDVRNVGYIGSTQVEQRINLQLAKRDGAIVSLVSETDLESMLVAHDPHLSLRFITERTRTINITAVGGNATLLELGSDAH